MSKKSEKLAKERTELARTRTKLAWARTGAAIAGLSIAWVGFRLTAGMPIIPSPEWSWGTLDPRTPYRDP